MHPPDATLIWYALNRAAIFGFIALASALLVRWFFLADTDSLTGLLNRRALVDWLRRAAVRAGRLETSVVIAFLDLDDFKSINDRFGYATSDAVLVKTARAVEAVIREGDVAARVGGDEFAALLWLSSASDAERVRKRRGGSRRMSGRTRARRWRPPGEVDLADQTCASRERISHE